MMGALAPGTAAMFRWRRARFGHHPYAQLCLPGPAMIGVIPLRATLSKKRLWKIVIRVDGNPHGCREFITTTRRGVRQTVREELDRLGVLL